MAEEIQTLSGRREFVFLYDIKMGNPNGDPDENRPRVLPDGTHYVTDVRLKRFVRDHLKTQTNPNTEQPYDILVDTIEERTTNLTGRVAAYLDSKGLKKCEGKELVKILLDSFIDARLFGSSFAFKEQDKWKPETQPKTLTGAVQINHGEVLHKAQEVDIHGTSVFASDDDKKQGTFTTYYALRYALIGFNGIANEHSAKLSHMTDADYCLLLKALWNSIRSAGNTRTKVGQVPRLLISVEYKNGVEFQYGTLTEYIKLKEKTGKKEVEWAGTFDYRLDLSLLFQRLKEQVGKIQGISYCVSPDLNVDPTDWPQERKNLDFDGTEKKEAVS